MKRIVVIALLHLILSSFVYCQGKYAVNQKVEVEWKGKWYKATILKVENDGYAIHYDGYASSWDETVVPARIRPIAKEEAKQPITLNKKPSLKYGKYGCSVSKYRNGSYEYSGKGSFVLAKDGTYTYHGFEKPSAGKFVKDSSGVVSFKGGYFNGGKATPIGGQENRYYLVFPTIPDGRWTCSCTE